MWSRPCRQIAAGFGRHNLPFLQNMANKSRAYNYLAGISTGTVRMLIHVMVGVCLTPFTLRFLDREEYAIFGLTLEILTWLTLLDVGISAGLRIQAARLTGKPDPEKFNR